MRVLCRGLPLLKYGDLNHILPLSEGRSDAACRVVIPPFALPIDSRINLQDARIGCRYASNGVNVGRSHYAATTSPQCRL